MSLAPYFVIPLSVSGALTTGVKPVLVLPHAARLVAVAGSVGTAPTGAALNFHVQRNGVSVTGAGDTPAGPVTIAAGATVSPVVVVTPGVAPGQNVYAPTVRDTADIAVFQAGDTIGLDVIEIGSTVAGSDLVVSLAFQKL